MPEMGQQRADYFAMLVWVENRRRENACRIIFKTVHQGEDGLREVERREGLHLGLF